MRLKASEKPQGLLLALIGFLLVIFASTIAILNVDKIFTQFLFATLLSLGVSILSVYITGKFELDGKIGNINLNKATSGFALFLLVFGSFFYFLLNRIENINSQSKKYFALGTLASFDIEEAYFTSHNNRKHVIDRDEIYQIISSIYSERYGDGDTLEYTFSFDFPDNKFLNTIKGQNSSYKLFSIKFKNSFDDKLIPTIEMSDQPGWHKGTDGHANFIYHYSFDSTQNSKVQLKLIGEQ